MRFSQVALLLAASSSVLAAPVVEKRWFPGSWWQESAQSGSLADFIKRHPWPGMGPLPSLMQIASTCDMSKAQLPQAPVALPPPSAGMKLYHVALGRGTQNYICDTTNSSAIPVAVGAVATLFNSTCMAATNNPLFTTFPATALALALPAPDSRANNNNPMFAYMSGHHYFTDNSTPYFNLDTAEFTYGQGAFKKLNGTAAPADADKGQIGQAYGAVPWLKLASKTADGCTFQEVYRVNTAGGNPPATCAGQAANIEIQYSAEYWFYAK